MSDLVGTTREGLLVTIWLFTSIALILFGFKLVIYRMVQHKLYWDDLFATLATSLLLVDAILYSVLIPISFKQLAIMAGNGPELSKEEQHDLALRAQHLLVPIQGLFWTGLWCVKFSFLFLYKLLLCHSCRLRIAWWICAAFMLLTWGVMLIAVFGQCGAGGDLYNLAQCNEPANLEFGRRMIWVEFVFVIITDIIVIVFPLPVLWRMDVSTRQRLALTPIFCLGLICIAFDTLRSVEQWKGSLTLGLLWTSLESEMAVIICLLPTFRFLISDSERSKTIRRGLLGLISLRTINRTHSKDGNGDNNAQA